MAQPFADLMKDLALARGSSGDGIDPDARAMRRRIAIIVWLPGAGILTWLAGWAQSVAVGVAGLALLLISLWLFAERGDRIAERVRRRIGNRT
jgi:uncharacterized protein (DUF58 family)